MSEIATPTETIQQTPDVRKSTLDRTLQQRGAEGWRIETRSDFQATVAKGNRINNTLHLILTIFTAGIWGLVWLTLAIVGGIERRMVTIDEYGNVLDRKI